MDGGECMDINRKRDKVAAWEMRGEHFTEYDIPDWVINKQYLAERVVPDLIRFWHCGKCILFLDGVIHFNKTGYRKIIECFERRELLRPDRLEKWKDIAYAQMGIERSEAACQ